MPILQRQACTVQPRRLTRGRMPLDGTMMGTVGGDMMLQLM